MAGRPHVGDTYNEKFEYMNLASSSIWCLHPNMNQTYGGSTFFLISRAISLKSSQFSHEESAVSLTSTDVPPFNPNVVNPPIRRSQSHDIITWAFPYDA